MNSASDYETLTETVKGWRFHPLAMAYACLGVAIVLAVMMVAIFGKSEMASPLITISLPRIMHTNAAPAPWSKTVLPSAKQAEEKAAPTPAKKLVPVGKPVYAGHALVADPALIEMTPQGPLPRVADDGRKPMDAYAPPVPAGAKRRIAIVMTGMGLSAKMTEDALKTLPAAVTLAFSADSDDLQTQVNAARKAGHEVLLEIPMEPYDFSNSDPGPHTLRADSGEDANTQRLIWAMTRFTGYAGVTNQQGGRFLASFHALEPVMTFLSRRGVLFYDDGSAANSLAQDVAVRADTDFVQGAFSVDAVQNPVSIDRALSDLEARARANGRVAATAEPFPVTITRLANWAKGLKARGFVLVPASAIVDSSK